MSNNSANTTKDLYYMHKSIAHDPYYMHKSIANAILHMIKLMEEILHSSLLSRFAFPCFIKHLPSLLVTHITQYFEFILNQRTLSAQRCLFLVSRLSHHLISQLTRNPMDDCP